MANKLVAIKTFGQKIWLDNISRELFSGSLQQLVNDDGIAGVTSNPAIFYKAISSDPRYQAQVTQLRTSNLTPLQRYEQIAIEDIKQTCQIMLNTYQQSSAEDGYVSLEVSPTLSHDVTGTITSAKELWNAVNYPNLMIKVPATKEGILAFEELVYLGINVNITLLFSLAQVNAVWDSYIRALERRSQQNLPINKIKTVASFFLSRIDSALDDKLPSALQGKTAINLAKHAYLQYQQIFHGPRFAKLAALGAKGQYLLWASTGTKNKNYSDVLYVEELIAAETINTVPDATLNAFRDHGLAKDSLRVNINQAQEILNQVSNNGINLEQLGEKLQQDGLTQFNEAFAKLLDLVK